MRNQKGITLIALVITIIVLLILAGVSIAMLTGDNGLLKKSQQAVMDNALGTAKDEISIAAQTGMSEYLEDKYTSTNGTNTDKTGAVYVQEAIVKEVDSDATDGTATIEDQEYNGCEVTVAAGKVTIVNNTRKVEGTIAPDGTLTWNPITNV